MVLTQVTDGQTEEQTEMLYGYYSAQHCGVLLKLTITVLV